jgi:hypothetical protein
MLLFGLRLVPALQYNSQILKPVDGIPGNGIRLETQAKSAGKGHEYMPAIQPSMSAIDKRCRFMFVAASKLDIDNVPDVYTISRENFAAQQITYKNRPF